MIVQLAVLIQIEIGNQEDKVFGRYLTIAVFSLKLAYFLSSDEANVVAIEAFE